MPSKIPSKTQSKNWNQYFVIIGLLTLTLSVLFFRSFDPALVVFSNDGPVGSQVAAMNRVPDIWFGGWQDLNSIGFRSGAGLNLSTMLLGVMKPVVFAKFYVPVALLILGVCAYFFFRQLRLSSLAALLGALAAMLNSTFFSDACWGVATHEIALGMDFLALGLVVASTPETPWTIRSTRLALAGLCVGVNVMEAADIGALYSILIAVFVFFKSVADSDETVLKNIITGVSRVAVISVFAGFIAYQTVVGLVGTVITGIAGTGQDTETKAAHWDFASQWSLPKAESLGLFVPGLFGYKMNTPMDMMPALRHAYRGGAYWGGMGRDPEVDRFFDSGGQGTPPPYQFMRQTGGGNYCGILVALIAAWAMAQSFRRQNSPFTGTQKKHIWFWAAVLVGSLLLSWGRFAPFDYYRHTLYALPYFSTIRSPAKFVIFLSWAMVILFGYGVHALSQRYLEVPAGKSNSFSTQLKNWWTKANHFDRRWTYVCGGLWGASMLGWFIYTSEKPALVHYLQARGFPDEDFARQIIAFSIGQAGWWLVIFAAAIVLLTLSMAGCFAGPRAKLGGLLLGGFLVMDLGRANLPYINYWDYKQKYEVGSLNPVEDFLRDKSYEHRVAILPFETQQQLRAYDNNFGGLGIYRIEWTQHHFLYYNIQSLDIIQMSRMPEDLKSYIEALSPRTEDEAPLYARHWQLTNTRYLLGPAGFLNEINQKLDPAQHRFRIAQRFDIVAKPDITQPTGLEELTAAFSPDGDLALFDFTGALPRAKLYSNWQVSTNDPVMLQQWLGELKAHLPESDYSMFTNLDKVDQATLETLSSANFDPQRTVLVSSSQPTMPGTTNENSGTVEFKSYAPKRIIFAASAPAPSVLLLNDKYDPNWRVIVDGKPAELLRCNYIMRGVYLPTGSHTVEFQFSLPNKPLYVTLAAIAIGIFLLGLLIFLQRRKTGGLTEFNRAQK